MLRVRMFVDFWNFQLNWNVYHDDKKTDPPRPAIPWKDLPEVLTTEAFKGQTSRFMGARVFASINKDSEKDRRLSGFLHHGLASIKGYNVDVRERKPRKRIYCNNEACREPISKCPKCASELKGSVEKGIDAAIVTDLLSGAFDGVYDAAILVSGDADFAPAVEYIQKKTDKQIVSAFFKDHGDELRNACWDHIFFDDLMGKLLST